MNRRNGLCICLLLAGVLTAHAQSDTNHALSDMNHAQSNTNAAFKDADPKELVARKDLSFDKLEQIQRYYRFDLKDERKAAELEDLMVKKDPKSAFARFVAFHQIDKARTPDERILLSEAFLEKFPIKEWNHTPERQSFIYYTVYRTLGEDYFSRRAFTKLLSVCASLDFKTENEIYRWNITRAFAFSTVGYDTLSQISTALVDDLIGKVRDGSYIEDGVFDSSKAQDNANEQLDSQLGTHIKILCSLKRYAEAKRYYAYFSPAGKFASSELNELYMTILVETGDSSALQPFLEKAVASNALTPAMIVKLKQLYAGAHHGMDGYDAYEASLHNQQEQDAMRSYVKEHLAKWEYQPFALEDADGKLVRSSDWGNRIVVIDFWATWCRPCIEAFPGMQMLIDKYSKDDQVAVYFIGTMQFGDYKAKSVGYVKKQGYHGFHLLHDAVDKTSGEQDLVFKSFVPFFKSSAIPRKIVLKDGLLRYTAEGYSGSPSKLVDELSYVIELLKAEDK